MIIDAFATLCAIKVYRHDFDQLAAATWAKVVIVLLWRVLGHAKCPAARRVPSAVVVTRIGPGARMAASIHGLTARSLAERLPITFNAAIN